jgi:hypothetical protein
MYGETFYSRYTAVLMWRTSEKLAQSVKNAANSNRPVAEKGKTNVSKVREIEFHFEAFCFFV